MLLAGLPALRAASPRAADGDSASMPARAPATPPSPAAPPGATRPSEAVTETLLQARMLSARDNKALDEPIRAKAVELYKQALEQARLQKDWQARAAGFDTAAAEAPAALEEARARLDEPVGEAAASLPPDAPLPQAEQALASAQAQANAARREVNDLDKEAKVRNDRRSVEIPKQLETIRTVSDDLQKQLAASPPADEPPDLALARRSWLQAQDQTVRAQRSALFRERASYDRRGDLLQAQTDLANLKYTQAQKLVALLRELVNSRRQDEAQGALAKAQERLACVDPQLGAVAELAQQNVDLARRRTGPEGMTARIRHASDAMNQATADLTRLNADFRTVAERAEAAAMSHALYLLLRRVQASLPDVPELEAKRRGNQTLLEQARMDLFELDDRRLAAKDLDARAQEVLHRLDRGLPAADPEVVRKQVAGLLKAQQGYLDALKADYNTYVTRLTDLDSRQKRLLDETRKFNRFIDERVLWVRSAQPMSGRDLPPAANGLGWLASPAHWEQVARTLGAEAASRWPIWAVVLAPLLGLPLARRRLLRRLEAISREVAFHKADTMTGTFKALALTLLIALPGPLMGLLAGAWALAAHPPKEFISAIAAGLLGAALVALPLEVFRQVCRADGLAQGHFRWPAASLRTLRRWIGASLAIALPLAFLVAATGWHADEAGPGGAVNQAMTALGRLAFLPLMLATAAFVLRVLAPRGRGLRGAMLQAQGRDGWAYRLRYVWYSLAVATPLLLAAAAALGYYYTAVQLSYRLLATVALVMGLVLLHALLVRWLSLARRRLAMDRLRKQSAPEPAKPSALSAAPAKARSEDMDLSDVGSQSTRLARVFVIALLLVGGFLIWADVLPALAILNKVELWKITATVSQNVLAPDGTATTTAVEKVVPVTLADGLLAAGMALLTLAASRNLPGLMEVTVLRRLRWDFGSRYAFVTILRYLIVVAGVVIVFGLVGVSWSKVQWLIAAVTVGLGFGLQEIFANFVSGLILLFERPMRVGDIVTVGDITGTVTRIRIRATTIMNLDRKELIVPNKEFITGKLVNWTLSDTVIRVIIPIGVSYDADTPKVLSLLTKIAREQPVVLKDPAPQIEFVGFGDSALNFEVRVFVTSYPNMLIVRNQIHATILQAFREAGIQIPFPQRDVHVRTSVERGA